MRRDIEKAATRSHNFSRREGITDCQLAKNRDITQNPKPAASPPCHFCQSTKQFVQHGCVPTGSQSRCRLTVFTSYLR
jgi:hypothetical protein